MILERLPKDSVADKDTIEDCFINFLKEMRFGTMNITEPKNKKKLEVVAGRSEKNVKQYLHQKMEN